MGQVISGTATGTTSSYTIIDVPSPGVMGPTVVNSYTTLSVPSYFRAMSFKSANMASFPRSIRKAGVEVTHRLTKLLQRKPNAYQSPTMLFRTWFFHQAHYSNGFLEIQRDSLYNPVALHNRAPELVAPFRILDDDGSVSGWYWVGGMKPHIVAAADMLHLTGLSYDGMTGLNPVWIHAETFERARLMDRYITRFLVKGSVVRGCVQIPAGQTDEQQDAIVDAILKHRGTDSERDLLVLSGGATFNNNGISNDQSQLVQLHDLSDVQISQLTDVHPYFLFADKSKYNKSPEQAGEDIVRYLFRLLIEQAEDELLKLLTEAEQDAGLTVHIDPAALIRGDGVAEAERVAALATAGVISRNEGRSELGYAPSKDPDADKLKVLGDTAPPPADNEPVTSSRAPALELFAALIADAAGRVATKTKKATEAARTKNGADNESFTRWGNVFSGEQEAHVGAVLTPVIDTIAQVTGQSIDTAATVQKIGAAYASQLRGHYSRLVRKEQSQEPDLNAMVLDAMKETP